MSQCDGTSHGTADQCYDVFNFRWAVGLGLGSDQAVEIRNILIFRYYVGLFRDIIWLINSLLWVRPGPGRFSVAITRPGPARSAGRPAPADL